MAIRSCSFWWRSTFSRSTLDILLYNTYFVFLNIYKLLMFRLVLTHLIGPSIACASFLQSS
jgi:hypothetical protein